MDKPNTKRRRRAVRMKEAARVAAAQFDNPMFGEMYAHAIEQYTDHNNPDHIKFLKDLHTVPVGIEEFLESDEFMGSTDLQVWPEVRKAIVDACKDWWKGDVHGSIREVLLTGATGCVDKYTEFLTPDGWKRVSDYDPKRDTVMQYSEDGSAQFVKPLEYTSKPCLFFLHFKNRTVDQMLTPGHTMVFRSNKTGKILQMQAQRVAEYHNRTQVGFSTGNFVTEFQAEGGKGIPLTDAQLRIMVAVISRGKYIKEEGTLCEVALRPSESPEELQALLRMADIPYDRRTRSDGHTFVGFNAPQRNPELVGWYQATAEQLQTIASEITRWIGDVRKNRVNTPNQAEADFVQYAFTATGTKTNISYPFRGGDVGFQEYVAHISSFTGSRLHSSNKQQVVQVPSVDGKCYCFTMPTGMWVARREGKVFVTGNTGKSEIAKVVTAYHMHILACMKNPQRFYGLPSATSIVMVIQAAKPHVTKKVIYTPLRNYIETMPWFQRNLRPNKLIEAEMYFEKLNLRVVPGGADSDTILGEAIIGGVIDEINFMNVVTQSKKADVGGGGRAGKYDQAQQIYDAVTRRKKGRFITRGPQVGLVCVSSSRRYRGDFTDRRQKHVEDVGEAGVLVYDKAQYEARPASLFSGVTFQVALKNDASGDIKVLKDGESAPRGSEVFDVPVEYLDEFLKDPAGAVRDIIGRSTNSVAPFFRNRAKISDAFARGAHKGLESIVHKDNVILGIEGMPRVKRDRYCRNPSRPRYVHIDLSATGDRCGVAMIRFDGMIDKARKTGISEKLPQATVELAITIEPDHESEIDIAEVRAWVKDLKDTFGYPIKAVTYDGWSSLESRQAWKKAGMRTGLITVDRTSVPYKQLRDAFHDGRIDLYPQEVLEGEIYDLEYDEKKDKVDHPPHSSKDCADAVCGAYYSMVTKSGTWTGALSEAVEDPRMQGRPDPEERFGESRPE